MESYFRFSMWNSSAIFSAASTATRKESTVAACLRNQSHFGVHVVSQLANIFRIGTPEMVGLIVNLDTDTARATSVAITIRLTQMHLLFSGEGSGDSDWKFVASISNP